MMKKTKYKYAIIISFAALFLLYILLIPVDLFQDPFSTVIYDRDGNLLGAAIADDGQWRFPPIETTPEKYMIAATYFEDEYFFYHPGFNPASILRAAYQNITQGKIVSGGSTITMQLIRLSRKGKERSVIEKIIEIIMATRIELACTKDEILSLYASYAPFGGNTVGIEAASRRYFDRSADNLSWAEAASLAVLPNRPGLIYPGRNRTAFKKKRDRLLDKLRDSNILDSLETELAKSEPLPGKPKKLPRLAQHLLFRSIRDGHKGEMIQTTIKIELQKKVTEILKAHHNILRDNEIHNAAAIIIDVDSGDVLAYVGNICDECNGNHGSQVDIITAPRSTGSILKPFLYAAMLNEGLILPKTLIPDIPTYLGGFAPQNFTKDNDGAVPADEALFRSLNIPAVRNLQNYGVGKFHYKLNKLGFTSITKPPGHYGLSLILGGAETSLWELSSVYATMSRVLKNYYIHRTEHYSEDDLFMAKYLLNFKQDNIKSKIKSFSAASIWFTFKALTAAYRPETESSWEMFSSSQKIAWKTGTSFGFKDAWSIGVTAGYVVGVWAGNADGEGRPGLTGLKAAAPIMFDIFESLPRTPWYDPPYDEIVKIPVCVNSGHRANLHCPSVDSARVPRAGLKSRQCSYCKLIHLDKTRKFRVNSDCEDVDDIVHENRFILPPILDWYYKTKHSTYRSLPPHREDCPKGQQSKPMMLIYPQDNANIYVPLEIDGTRGKTVFKAAHRNPSATIYWHIDEKYFGSTKRLHSFNLSPAPGNHVLTLVDDTGEIIKREFTSIDISR